MARKRGTTDLIKDMVVPGYHSFYFRGILRMQFATNKKMSAVLILSELCNNAIRRFQERLQIRIDITTYAQE